MVYDFIREKKKNSVCNPNGKEKKTLTIIIFYFRLINQFLNISVFYEHRNHNNHQTFLKSLYLYLYLFLCVELTLLTNIDLFNV